MLQASVLTVDDEQAVFTATIALEGDRASFADALIGAINAKAGCSATVTFDGKAARLAWFELL